MKPFSFRCYPHRSKVDSVDSLYCGSKEENRAVRILRPYYPSHLYESNLTKYLHLSIARDFFTIFLSIIL